MATRGHRPESRSRLAHPKTKTNSVWQAAIRRTLKFDPELERAARGVWRIKVLPG
jgi:predicted RNase H-like nuclease